MNLLNVLAAPNPTTILLLGGVSLLLVNILYGILRATRGNLKAGWFTILLALAACAMIAVGTVQTVNASRPNPAAFGGRTAGSGIVGGGTGAPATADAGAARPTLAPTVNASQPTSAAQANTGVLVSNTTGTSGDSLPAQAATPDASGGTPQANGTPGQRGFGGRRTPGPGTPAAGSFSGNGQNPGASGNSQSSGGAASGGSASGGQVSGGDGSAGNTGATGGGTGNQVPAAITETQLDQAALSAVLVGGGLGIILALVLFFMERRRPGFISANSRGLLNLGAGFFVVVAVLIIPLIPGQPSQAAAAAAGVRIAAIRARAVPSATPSSTPLPTATATLLPTFTPTVAATPMAMATQIPYTSTYTVNLQKSLCTATANTVLSLRPDPSTTHQAIRRVIGGALLQIVGKNADGKWLNVINTDNGTSVQGWVSTSFVTENSSCAAQPLPVVDDFGKAVATAATFTPSAVYGATQAATQARNAVTGTAAATNAVTPADCTLFTTSSVYLRADPSVTHAPLAMIPDRTALTPVGKSASGQWWYVTYGSDTGWVGSAAVLASSSCSGVSLLTLTPMP